jgi:hypothetical protein
MQRLRNKRRRTWGNPEIREKVHQAQDIASLHRITPF